MLLFIICTVLILSLIVFYWIICLYSSSLPNVYYINLDYRKDRKEHFLNEMKKIKTMINKKIRISAEHHKIPTLGALKSHINALKEAYKNTNKFSIICEDDFTFKNDIDLINILEKCYSSQINWNVILLAGAGTSSSLSESIKTGGHLSKVIESQTASGYIIKREYIPTLLKLWKKLYDKTYHINKLPAVKDHLDRVWKQLQHDNWFITTPVLGYQYASYSDIEKKRVDYGV